MADLIKKIDSLDFIKSATHDYRNDMAGFDPETWLDGENIALGNDNGDLCLLEKSADKIYTGHYFFKVRGKEAIALAKDLLKYIFTETDAEVIRGLTPLRKVGARYVSRQIGMKSYGIIKTIVDPCEIFIITRKEWEQRNKYE